MKAVSFRGFAQYSCSRQHTWRRRGNNQCRICDTKITDRALYCTEHMGYRARLNKQMRRWLELEDKLDRGLITTEETKAIRVWP